MTKYEYLETIRRAQYITCLIARANQKKADQKPQTQKGKKGEPETFEVGELIQIRNLAPKQKLEAKWDKLFIITKIAPNAIHCVKWHLDLHPPYKLRQQPRDMGQIEECLVHPKDIKKWNSDLPPHHVWDQELVEQLLYPVQKEPEKGEESLNTSTASDYSKQRHATMSSSSSDSPRPPDGVMNIPEDEEEDSNNQPADEQTIKERRGPESMLHADDYYEMAKEILQKNREG